MHFFKVNTLSYDSFMANLDFKYYIVLGFIVDSVVIS